MEVVLRYFMMLIHGVKRVSVFCALAGIGEFARRMLSSMMKGMFERFGSWVGARVGLRI